MRVCPKCGSSLSEIAKQRLLFECYYIEHYSATHLGHLLEERKAQIEAMRSENGYEGDVVATRYWRMFIFGWTSREQEAQEQIDSAHNRASRKAK